MSPEPIIIVGARTLRRITGAGRRRALGVAAALAVALLALVAILAYPTHGGPTVAAKRGDIVHSLVAIGRVEADRTFEIVPKIAARIREVHAQEGDRVEAGGLLVSLEDGSIRAQHDEASRARDAAKARFDEVARGARPEDVDRAKARVEEAEQALKAVERGARPEEREEAEAALAMAQADGDHAAREHDRMRGLLEKGAVSQKECDDAKRRHDVALASLRKAKARRDLVAGGPTDEERAQAKARVAQEKAALARLATTDEERRTAEAELARAEAVVARLAFELSQTKLASPAAGIVARRYKEPSELAFPEMPQPILVVAASDDRIVRVEVHESDVYKLRVGQAAAITSDAFPGRRWSGKVTRVAPVMGKKRLSSESPKEKADVKVLEARIELDEKPDLPLNLPCEARIAETVRQGVIVLPARAVAGDQVRMADGSTRRLRLGARDDAFVEVVSGLAEGERVRE